MTATRPQIIELTEYDPASFAPHEIPEGIAETLYWEHRDKIEVEWPSPKTNRQWRLKVKGWVGYIPITSEFTLMIHPKVELANLFRMLEYAYQLKSFHFLEGTIQCRSLHDFYQNLANVLAKRILDRARKGFYRSYIPHEEQLPYIRGRLDVRQTMRMPWAVNLECRYEEHTADIEENQLLMWTLRRILQSGMCTERVIPTVRQAYRSLQGLATLQHFRPQDCINRLYNRLNEDYHPLHALCFFFLEHSGPSHETGERTMLPFLVNMARLYERFVAEWLNVHLPLYFSLKIQERLVLDEEDIFHIDIDLVLQNTVTGEIYVLDTKYKSPNKPSQDDINQIVAYATAKNCRNAVLIYPTSLARPLNILMGKIRIRSMTFALDGDLDQAGQAFLQDLLHSV